MRIGRIARHFDALSASDPEIKQLVSSSFSIANLSSFRSTWNGPDFDVYAFIPVIEAIQDILDGFSSKYGLTRFKVFGFLMSSEDALVAAQCFEFLKFLSEKSVNYAIISAFMSILETDPHVYALAANPSVAIAASQFGIKYETPFYADSAFYQETLPCIARGGFIPIYGSKYRGCSDYTQYLTDIPSDTACCTLLIGNFRPSDQRISSCSTLELISEGMKIVPREQWLDLIYECRKLEATRANNLETRIEMVKLHVALSLFHEVQKNRYEDTSLYRYVDVLCPQLLEQFPSLVDSAISILEFPSLFEDKYSVQRMAIMTRIQNDDLFLYALQRMHPGLMNALSNFYSKCPKMIRIPAKLEPVLLSPAASILTLRLLEQANAVDLDTQLAILLAFKVSLDKGNDQFATANGTYTSVIQQFIVMLRRQLDHLSTRQVTEVCKGLLKSINGLVSQASAIALASDTVTLSTLAEAITHESLQASAAKALSEILGADLICFTHATDLWPKICSAIEDPFALVLLYSCLVASDRGQEVIGQFDLDSKLLKCVFECNRKAPHYSEEFYSLLTECIPMSLQVLEQFASGVPKYLDATLEALDASQSEFHYDTRGFVFSRHTKTERIVDHCIWLLTALVHRDLVRKQLLAPESIDLLLKILAHPHLPYEYFWMEPSNSYLQTLIQELALTENLPFMMIYLLEKLADSLDSNDMRSMSASVACIRSLSLEGPDTLRDAMIPLVTENKNLHRICVTLYTRSLELCYKEAHLFAGKDAPIVECFWAGYKELNLGANSVSQMGQRKRHYAEIAALKRLDHTVPLDEYDKIRADAKFIRYSRDTLKQLRYALDGFLQTVSSCKLHDVSVARELFVSSALKTMGSISLENVEDRYAFAVYQDLVDSYDDMFVPLGGFEILTDAYVKLCLAEKRSKEQEGKRRTLRRFMHNRSDYIKDCKKAIEVKMAVLSNYFCTEQIHDTLNAVECQGRGIRKLVEGFGYLFQKLAQTHVPFLGAANDIFIDQDHDLAPYLWVQEFAVANYAEILDNQSIDNILQCAKLMATIIIRFERHNPVIDELVAQLYEKADTPSLALLGGLIDQNQGGHGDLSKVLLQIESNKDPKTVMVAAQVLKRSSPQALRELGPRIPDILTRTTHPKTMMMLLELTTAGLLCKCLTPSPELVNILLGHCLNVFEDNDFNHTCAVGLVSLMDTIRAVLDDDISVLSMIMAYIIGGDGPTSTVYPIDSQVAKLGKRSIAALQEAVERYVIVDSEAQDLYWRRYLHAAEIAPAMQSETLQDLTKTVCDKLMAKYIGGADELLSTSIAYHKANLAYKSLHNRAALFQELAWGSSRVKKATEECLVTWNQFRKVYMKMRVYVDGLVHVTTLYSPTTDYITSSDQFDEFVAASIKCAASLGVHLSFVGAWHQNVSKDHFRTRLFWPVVNILECGSKTAMKRTLDAMESTLGDSNNARQTTFGILYLLQIQEFQINAFFKQFQQSKLMSLFAQFTDFKATDKDDIFKVERLVYQFVDKISGQVGDLKSTCEASGVTLKSSDEDFSLPELTVFAEVEEEDLDGEDLKDEEGEDLSEAGEDLDPADFDESGYYDEDESDFESEFAYSDPDIEPCEQIMSPFDVGAYKQFLPRRNFIYSIWEFREPENEGSEGKTILQSYHSQETSQDSTPIYLWTHNSAQLLLRGLDLGVGLHPADPDFECSAGFPWGQFQLLPWPEFSDVHRWSISRQATVAHVTRPWEDLEPTSERIDWNKVERLDKSKLDNPDFSSNSDKIVESSLSASTDTNQQSPGDSISDEFVDFALRKACELLENPELMSSWGIDRVELEALPEELHFDTLVSWILVNRGEDMTAQDVLATLGESELLDVCDDQSTKDPALDLPKGLRIATKAQIDSSESVSKLIEQRFFEHNQPPAPQWPEKMHIEFIYHCGEEYVRYPSQFSSKKRDNALLEFLVEHAAELPARSVHKTLDYLFKVPAGSLNAIQLLNIVDLPIITGIDVCMSALVGTVRAHIETLPEGKPLKSDIIDKLMSAFYTRTLLPMTRKVFVSMVETLIAKRYVTQARLRAHVYQDLLAQLDMCMSIKRGVINTRAFSDLETTLSVLSSQKICDLNKNNEAIVEKAMELGPHVSNYIYENDASGIRLLRCYLLLVSLAPDARPAFVKFVQENRALVNKSIVSDRALLEKCAANLKGHYDLLDYPVKVQLVRLYSSQPDGDAIELGIRREKLVDDTLLKLKNKNLKASLRIKFADELGFDDGGLTREWLVLFGRGLPESDLGLFNKIVVGNHFTIHPNPQSLYEPSDIEFYETVGKIMAKAILMSNSFDCKFSSVIFKALLTASGSSLKLSIQDLDQFDPQLANSLKWIRDNTITDVIMETFTAKSTAFGEVQLTELKPGGKTIEVTEANKHEYIDLLIQHIYKGVEKQISAITKGFHSLLPLSVIKTFDAAELEMLLCGSQEINVAEWKASTSYRGYTSDSKCVLLFWQVVEAMSNDERRKLLMFVTGCDSVSSLGFTSDASGTKFVIAKQSRGSLPVASTCLSTLHIPPYSSYDEARVQLSKAIELAGEGFALV